MLRAWGTIGLWALLLAFVVGAEGPSAPGADPVAAPQVGEAAADVVEVVPAAADVAPAAEPAEAKPADAAPAEPPANPPPEAKPAQEPAPAAPPAENVPAAGDKPAGETPDAAPEMPPVDVEELVRQLGSEEYKLRRDAAEKLTKVGLDARDALLAGLRFPDPEVRRACRRILAGVLESDFQRRLDAFIKDEQGTGEHDLPGWKRYRTSIGQDKEARNLYVEMLRAEVGLLATAEAGDSQTAEALQLRFQQVYQSMYTPDPRLRKQPDVGSIAALLFVLGDPKLNLSSNVVDNMYLPQIIYHQSFQQLLNGQKATPAARKLVGLWIRRPSGPNMLPQKLSLAMQYNLRDEGLELGIYALGQKNLNAAYIKAHAVMAVGKLGGKEYAQVLADQLADQTVCMTQVINNKQVNVEIRDVALGWLVFVTGQDLAEYNMPAAKQAFEQMKKYPQYQVNYTFMKFDSPEKREEALKKWKAYVAEHPLPARPEPVAAPGEKPADKPTDKPEEKPADPKAPAPNAGGNAAPAQPNGNAANGNAPNGNAAPAVNGAKAAAPAADAQKGDAPKADDKQPDAKPDAEKDKQAQNAPPAKVQRAVALPALAPGVIAAGAAPALGKGQAEGEKEEERLEVGGGLRKADRLEAQRLLEARRLIAAKEYAGATEILGEILLDDVDYAFQPDRGINLFRGFKTEAERLLSELPREGLEAYELQFQPRAQRQLQAAIESGRAEALARVVESFFFTTAGAEATYLLGARYRLEGEPLRAGLYLARLRARHRAARAYEPELSLQLAVCWAQAGLQDQARTVLGELFARQPSVAVIRDDAQNPLPANPAAALEQLARDSGPFPAGHDLAPWAMVRGDATHNGRTLLGLPHLVGQALAPFTSDPFVRDRIGELRSDQLKRKSVSIPSFAPLVVGDRVVLRGAAQVQAFDLATGELAWESPLDDSLASLALMRDEGHKNNLKDSIRRGLERRLWNDPAFGQMSSNGSLVFGIEGLPFEVTPDFQRRVVAPDGKMLLDVGGMTRSNTLVAYDLRTGKLRWEAGGPGDGALAGAYFLAAPLPLAGRLYAVAVLKTDETHLVEIDPASGKVLARMVIDEKSEIDINPMARFGMNMPQIRALPRTAAGPAAADGVLVCPTSDNRFVAVDLTARKVLWVFDGPKDDPASSSKVMAAMQFGIMAATMTEDTDRGDRWNDSSPVIGGGCVVLTPRRSGSIFCLSLASGNLLWQDSRRDGLYLAGIHDGLAVVVGRSSVWAYKLADGAAAWSLELPPGSFSSGRGVLSASEYLLPLTSAEVASIDLATGRLLARSRSPSGIVPGNLAAGRDRLVTQTPEGVWQLPTLAARLEETAAALAAAPDNAAALVDRGEALLSAGRVTDAIACLRTALAKEATPRTRQLLLDALSQGLRSDVAAFQQVALEFDKLADQAERRDEFLKQIALALHASGEREAALAAYLKLVDLNAASYKLEPESAATDVRRDRWVQARLWELRSSSPPEFQAKIDAEVAARLSDDKLRPFLAFFGAFPQAHEARLRLARQLVEQKQWQEADFLLRQVAQHGPPALRPEATARLAAMLREANSPAEAALVYARLAGPLADVVCLDGRKGSELMAALPAGDPVRKWLEPARVWPRGPVKKDVANGSGNLQYRYLLPVAYETGPFARSVPLDVDPSGQNLNGYDSYGRQLWQVPTPNSTGANGGWSINGTIYSYSQSRLVGHSLFVWMGNRVVGVSTLPGSARQLWSSNTIVSPPPFPNMMRMFPFGMQQFRQPEMLGVTRPQMLVAAGDYVCFQQEHALVAVDPLSGQTLWSRDGLEEDCDLIGDAEVILVTDSRQRETVVLSAIDGRELGRRPATGLDQRLTVNGRRVVLWDKPEGRSRLRMVDALTGQEVWSRDFAETAFPWQCGPEEVGVYQADGAFAVLSLVDGGLRLEAKTEAQPDLQDAIVMRSGDFYLLLANQPREPRRDGMNLMFFPQQFPGSLTFNGTVRAFDRQTGKQAWQAEIKDQMFRVDQPAELPILAFCSQVHRTDGRTSSVFERQVCLDKRTGVILHDEQGNATGAQYQLIGDPEAGKMEVRMQQKKIVFALQAEAK